MNKKAMLEQVNSLLKAAKENPEQFKELTKNKESGMAANDKGMTKAEILAAAKAMIELAKKEPQKFEEMAKAMAAPAPAPAAPMAKPAAPKLPAPAAMMKPKAPGASSMRMSKEEIKADLAKPFTPKHAKKAMGAC